MDVTLPNGVVIRNVPDGTSKDEIRLKAIEKGLAKAEDFPVDATNGNPTEKSTFETLKTNFRKGFGDAIGVMANAPFLPAQIVEPAMTMASGTIAQPVAGLAGAVSTPFVGGTKAGQIVRDVQQSMTYMPRTEAGMQSLENIGGVMKYPAKAISAAENYLGDAGYQLAGPVGGAIGKTIPTAVLLAGSLRAHKPKVVSHPKEIINPTVSLSAKQQADDAARLAAQQADEVARLREAAKPPVVVNFADKADDAKDMTSILKSLRDRKGELAAESVKPDKAVMDAAERLKINLSPSHYSTNPTYIDLEQALKSNPRSGILSTEITAIKRIGEEAEGLITSLGGSPDRTVFSARTADIMSRNIQALEKHASSLYKKIDDAIPPATPVTRTASKSYLAKEVEKLGGNMDLLTAPQKDLLRMVSGKKPVTYYAMDRVRQDIGAAYRRTGPYKDVDSKILNEVYGAISDDQLAVTRRFGVSDQFVAAKKLVQTRKQLEEQSVRLFGRDVMGSAAPKIKSVAKDLVSGNTGTLRRFLRDVPENLRQDASVAVLNDVLVSGSRTGTEVGQGFATAYRALQKNRGALDALLRELPEGARKRFDDIGRVADALYRAKARENVSRSARDVIEALDSPHTIAKIYDVGRKVAVAEGATSIAGVPGAGTVGILAGEIAKTKTAASQIADDFLSSPQFRAAIDKVASGDIAAADKLAMSGPHYKNWITEIPPESQKRIATIGLIGWLSAQDEK